MGRAIVAACAALMLGVVGCADTAEDTAQTVSETTEVATSAVVEEVETTTTTRPRPTTTTTTTTSTTTTTTAPPTTTTTAPPTTTTAPPPPPPPTTAAPVEPVSGGCDPSYSGCVPIASDVDCAGGSGDGPEYVTGPVQVIGSDPYGLDNDGDGVGCES